MRLISCYIENFGGMHKFSYEFKEGLNCIMQENGWGKTTLATFLKAMFYGMEKSTKRNLDENERKKYEPWNGGAYGGNLVFETDGETYRIERFFGTKDKEDSFMLYDIKTGLESNAYSKNIGEELFGIDRVSFEQSIFMKQGKYAVSLTDSAAAKMSGLMAGGDDLDCYEKACGRLEAEMKFYHKNGNKGKIPELEEEVAGLKRKIAEAREIESSLEEWKKQKEECLAERESNIRQKEELKKQIRRAGEQAVREEKYRHYMALEAEKERLRGEVEVLDSYFHNGMPGEEELEHYRDLFTRYRNNHEKQPSLSWSHRYPELAERLSAYPVTEEELDACEEKWNQAVEKELLLAKKELQLQVWSEKEQEEAEQRAIERRSLHKIQTIIVMIAVLAIIVAVLCYFMVSALSAGIMAAISVVAIIGFVLVTGRKKKLGNDEEECEEIIELQEECDALEAEISKNKKSVSLYLQGFAITGEKDVLSYIHRIRVTLNEQNRVDENRRLYEEAEAKRLQEKECLRTELLAFLSKYGNEGNEPNESILREIAQKRNEYVKISGQYEALCKQTEQTECEKTDAEDKLPSVEELQRQELVLEEQMEASELKLSRMNRTIEQYMVMLEDCEQWKAEVEELEEKLSDYRIKYKRLEKTLKYLNQAKNEFSSRYLRKMNAGFMKYRELFRKGTFEGASLDVKLAIKCDEDGVKRDIGYYSAGMRETMELCSRLALIDALFEKEEPFVVLDDPFVNLDEKSMEGAKHVLAEIAQEYQLIYFTCHPSRQ
ncbi:MAG: AAA family ATPase [Lachnospiraceae bacterium]|nr:AAA family ATPase [Lachnospiraceae bacterium]